MSVTSSNEVPSPLRLYHLTHVANLQRILEQGGLLSVNMARGRNVAWHNIAHAHIRNRRAQRGVPVDPKGTLNDYVPWYFGPRPPMLLPLRDNRVEGYDEGQAPLVHLVTSLPAVKDAKRPWLFTDKHAVLAYANFFNQERDLQRIDWPLMQARYWNQTGADPDRPARRQAEFLVHEHLPWSSIESIGVIDGDRKREVETLMSTAEHKPQVVIKRAWYY